MIKKKKILYIIVPFSKPLSTPRGECGGKRLKTKDKVLRFRA